MKRSCMNCTNREATLNCLTGKMGYRCSLDREMRVNRRMCCEEWSGQVTASVTDGACTGMERTHCDVEGRRG